MNRKLFLRNSLMALAVSLLPKALRPVEVEVVSEGAAYYFDIVDSIDFIPTPNYWYINGDFELFSSNEPISSTVTVTLNPPTNLSQKK